MNTAEVVVVLLGFIRLCGKLIFMYETFLYRWVDTMVVYMLEMLFYYMYKIPGIPWFVCKVGCTVMILDYESMRLSIRKTWEF